MHISNAPKQLFSLLKCLFIYFNIYLGVTHSFCNLQHNIDAISSSKWIRSFIKTKRKPLSFCICLNSCLSFLTQLSSRYKIKLDSDDTQYGGHGRLDHSTEFFTEPVPFNERPNSMQVHTHTHTLSIFLSVFHLLNSDFSIHYHRD